MMSTHRSACREKADKKIREILNDDQKKKLDQLEQQAHPELHGNLNGATPPPRHHRFEESAVTYRARRWANNLSI